MPAALNSHRYDSFDSAVRTASKELLRQRIGTKDDRRAVRAMQTWADQVAEHHGIDSPTVLLGCRADACGDGVYFDDAHLIVLSVRSNVELFTQFRLAMQHHGTNDIGPDDDAHSWAVSLYRNIAPRTFERLVAERKIKNP